MKQWIPWYGRIAAKLFLSRLPIQYRLWRRLNIFAHGSMEEPDYALKVFRQHFNRSHFARKWGGFVALELGPGDSLLSAILAKSYGASTSYLIDIGPFATSNLSPYRAMIDLLRSEGLRPPDLERAQDLEGVLAACDATYESQGIRSLRRVPSGSVDFIWSHAVLEHIRRQEFSSVLSELSRILRPDGICSHRIDLKDHIGGALNNLRVPTRYWEADWMARSGFYTNRIRFSEMLTLFNQAGFDTEVLEIGRWAESPTPQKKMAREFRNLNRDDLLISSFDVLLTKIRPHNAQRVFD